MARKNTLDSKVTQESVVLQARINLHVGPKAYASGASLAITDCLSYPVKSLVSFGL